MIAGSGSVIADVIWLMAEFKINSFSELHKVLEKYRTDKRWCFRGQSDSAWPLQPKAGRSPYNAVDDAMVFASWKRRAVEFTTTPPESDWEWLAIAQHHGLATRLLDWTLNPLNAAFFAARRSKACDAIVYALRFKYEVRSSDDPMNYPSDTAIYFPRGIVPRITRQYGLFSIQSNPETELSPKDDGILEFDTIVIPGSARKGLIAELSFYGINSASLFPDLDGLSEFLNWTVESGEYFHPK